MRWVGLAAVALLLALPAVLGSYALSIFIFIFFYAYLGQAWNIVGGYAGQLSAGHAAFVGVGAYTAAVLSLSAGLTPWIGMFVGGALSAMLGAVIGYLGFRFGLRGFYFVLLTVAVAEMCRIVTNNVEALGGAVGLYITFTGNPRHFQFQDTRAYYYVALGLMIAATVVAAAIERRRFGVYLSAIREDEGAEQEEQGRAHDEPEIGIDSRPLGQEQGEIHPPDHHVAVGKVHHAHDAEDQRQPHGHEAVDAAEEQSVEQPLTDEREVHARATWGRAA